MSKEDYLKKKKFMDIPFPNYINKLCYQILVTSSPTSKPQKSIQNMFIFNCIIMFVETNTNNNNRHFACLAIVRGDFPNTGLYLSH